VALVRELVVELNEHTLWELLFRRGHRAGADRRAARWQRCRRNAAVYRSVGTENRGIGTKNRGDTLWNGVTEVLSDPEGIMLHIMRKGSDSAERHVRTF